jgi:hypothetical protein
MLVGIFPELRTNRRKGWSRVQPTDLAHLIDTTARPRASQFRHRTRSLRSSTLFCGLRPL